MASIKKIVSCRARTRRLNLIRIRDSYRGPIKNYLHRLLTQKTRNQWRDFTFWVARFSIFYQFKRKDTLVECPVTKAVRRTVFNESVKI